MKNYDPNKKSLYPMYYNVNNLYGQAMSQKMSAYGFKWRQDLFRFDEEFIHNYDEHSDKRYIFEVDIDYPNQLQKNIATLHSYA